jgi:peptide/nickel transport system substrate-binding protein
MGTGDNYWQRRARAGNLSRRKFLGGAATAIGGGALLAAGCGGDDNTSGSSTAPATGSQQAGTSSTPGTSSASVTATPKKGGTYTAAYTGVFAGVDPHNSVYGGAGIIPEVYNYLIRDEIAIHPEKGIIHDLAESHKLEDDQVTWTFKLRPNVMITANDHGVPERALDSEDVLKSWQRIADAQSGSNGYAFANQWIDHMDTPDPQTFRMIMKEPYAWTEATVGNNLFGPIVPREWLASADLKKDTVGGGPFKLTELVESDHATMVRNPTYYKADRPYLDKLIIRAFADQSTVRTAFTGGQTDIYGATNQDEAKEIKASNKNIQYYHVKSTGFDSFWMNTKNKPWDDGRVRRAVNLATDRSEYITIIGHNAGEPIGLLSYVFGDYALSKDELAKYQKYDPAEAKKLFEAAGVSEFTFSYPSAFNIIDYVNIFVRQMQKAGVKATAQVGDPGTWLAQYFTSKLSANLTPNQEYQTPDVVMQWYSTGGITGNGHYDTGFSDPEVDAAIKKAATTLDENERKQAYRDAQALVYQKDPPFFNFFGLYGDVVVAPYIHNYPAGLGSLGYAYEEEIWTDKV